jgi:broad specificity phosphatase PhoE
MSSIFVIRHAEKPDAKAQGVDDKGVADPDSLIPRGWQRAGALAVYFGSGLPAPNRIYAAAADKEKVAPHTKVGSKSKRPVETITPLAKKLGQTPVETYTKGQEADLAAAIAALAGVTLVCWQHEAIPDIARAIMGAAAGIPDPWPDDRFDVVWRFVRSDAGKSDAGKNWVFDQVCPCLLGGDQSKPIG